MEHTSSIIASAARVVVDNFFWPHHRHLELLPHHSAPRLPVVVTMQRALPPRVKTRKRANTTVASGKQVLAAAAGVVCTGPSLGRSVETFT